MKRKRTHGWSGRGREWTNSGNAARKATGSEDPRPVAWHHAPAGHIRFVRSGPPIETATYQEVARPFNDHAPGRWKRYARWLEPLHEALAPHVERLGYTA